MCITRAYRYRITHPVKRPPKSAEAVRAKKSGRSKPKRGRNPYREAQRQTTSTQRCVEQNKRYTNAKVKEGQAIIRMVSEHDILIGWIS